MKSKKFLLKHLPAVIKFLVPFMFFMMNAGMCSAQFFQKLKEKANQALDKKVDRATSTGTTSTQQQNVDAKELPATGGNQSLEAYQNYDFVPGDKIVFEDNFETDEAGEFPSHWALADGQATMNAVDGKNALLAMASATRVRPLMKSMTYLTDTFTIEFDHLAKKGYGLQLYFYPNDKEARIHDGEIASIDLCSSNSWNRIYTQVVGERSQAVDLPAAVAGENYLGKWHHIALIYKNKMLKLYIDQYRVLSLPEFNVVPKSFAFRADGAPSAPIVIAGVRVANGGGMKNINQKFTDPKIITHINFDIDKAVIRAESMGTLNEITAILKSNPDLKFDIQGHTDNSGDPSHNLTLSQQRADAVRKQLINMGVDAARLTSKGLGDTKPIADNGTPEGKANNRRVEFITIK